MNIQSEFRNALFIRILIGILLFMAALFYAVYNLLITFNPNPLLIVACLVVLFVIYCIPDIFEIFVLTIKDGGIEIKKIITGNIKFIPYEDITNIKRGKVRFRTKTGAISNGYYYSTLIFKNSKSIIISPDHFKNYQTLMSCIYEKF
ncbi:hypothetical protein [Flavobacterium nitrogenifigens]|uniref:Uncharacterized protein n=1 Tax=Flavobacterium nitrogenifigens TaxID=1617283 RepID=A0A521BB31_9FLAO|nr:hypothetical protein [Flavobacterium nitrogenifigens]KAF2335250.1 hypothetical protein DM397_07255 [Flavobacterium nitrogenifigens]SMO44302.1 hypothetical protein SAMN06265220_101850 [Flavobacterium nitrogenifigens]